MTPSPRIATFTQGYEKCSLVAFKPTPNDVWTIGWGHTDGVQEGDTCTQEQADDWWIEDLAEFSQAVSSDIGDAPTTQDQFDAMVSLAYNIGAGQKGFAGSTVLRKHRIRAYGAAAFAFSLWNKQDGVVLEGLVSRRAAEAAIYRGE